MCRSIRDLDCRGIWFGLWGQVMALIEQALWPGSTPTVYEYASQYYITCVCNFAFWVSTPTKYTDSYSKWFLYVIVIHYRMLKKEETGLVFYFHLCLIWDICLIISSECLSTFFNPSGSGNCVKWRVEPNSGGKFCRALANPRNILFIPQQSGISFFEWMTCVI